MPILCIIVLSTFILTSYAFNFPRIDQSCRRSGRRWNLRVESVDEDFDAADDRPAAKGSPQGRRFWIESVSYKGNLTRKSSAESVESIKRTMMESGLDVSQVEVGIVVAPVNDGSHQIIPIHDGLLQNQHTSYQFLHTSGDESTVGDGTMVVCGFYPRASHAQRSDEDERPLDQERFHALNQALLNSYGIPHTDLLEEKFVGTPPSRIYRSFVYPRNKPNYLVEPAGKAAQRVAAQIEMAIRQVRADEAEYLRNTDKDHVSTRDIQPVAFLLDNLRSAFNVGSIFRTAETGGVKEIVTAGITPHPPNPKLRKTAFTSVDVVASTHFDDVMKAVEYLKSNGYKIAVMETTERSEMYTEVQYPPNTVLVVGNEITGVDTRVIELADFVVQIPTYGIKNSLNVASAAPIVLYEVLRQWRHAKLQ